MGRTRDVSKILTSNTSILTLASASATYAPIAAGGLVQVVATSIAKGASGSASVDSKGNVTFSGTESISLNGIFTSSYDSYRMVFTSITASGNVLLRLRWRKSGTDNSGATYYSGVHFTNWTGTAGVSTSSSAATSAAIISLATGGGTLSLDINTPLSRPTVTGLGMATGPEDRGIYLSSYMNVTDTYDGVTFFPASGTISGTIRIYGYRN